MHLQARIHRQQLFCKYIDYETVSLTLEVTRAENRPKCTCLCCNNFYFHHTKLTCENLVSLESWPIFLDCAYIFLHSFSDRFFAVEFKKHVIQLLPIFGRFYYVLMNKFMHSFIKSTYVVSKQNSMSGQSAKNKPHGFSPFSQSEPWFERFIRFATFRWIIISSFCIEILTKCLTVLKKRLY